MPTNLLWQRCADGYTVVKNKNDSCFYVASKSVQMEGYHPIETHSAILRILSEKKDRHGYIEFADVFGLLTHETEPEPLATFESFSNKLRIMMRLYDHGDLVEVARHYNELNFGQIGLRLETSSSPPKLRHTVDHLLQAMWVQFGEMIVHGEGQEQCVLCNEWFAVGPTTNRRRKRFNAKRSFCCDAHAKRFEYINRKTRER